MEYNKAIPVEKQMTVRVFFRDGEMMETKSNAKFPNDFVVHDLLLVAALTGQDIAAIVIIR